LTISNYNRSLHRDELKKSIALDYFTAFSNKELDVLAGMFDDHVTLRDWEISVSGKTSVVAANKNIFDSVETIQLLH
jgi:hypothetical protein